MQIIPVIDLLNGVVVHAKKGERQLYQPMASLLTDSSEPLAIVTALLNLYPFAQLYIADLNAIQKSEKTYCINFQLIESIVKNFPQLEVWLDAGISNQSEWYIWQKLKVRLVLGSENFSHLEDYHSIKQQSKNFILSLDFMPKGYQGPLELLDNTEHWPQDVVLMSLANVGSNQGVDSTLLTETLARAKKFNLYAAGGVRNIDDLLWLKKIGVQGALIATALQKKQISSTQLECFAK